MKRTFDFIWCYLGSFNNLIFGNVNNRLIRASVDVTLLSERSGPTGYVTRPEQRTVPRPLTEYATLAALLVVLEVCYIR